VYLFYFTDNVQHYQLGNANLLFATTKEEMTTKIKNMENSAASVLCSLSAREKQHNHFLEDIIGVVALLGSVQSPELSRFVKFITFPIPADQKKETNTLNNLQSCISLSLVKDKILGSIV